MWTGRKCFRLQQSSCCVERWTIIHRTIEFINQNSGLRRPAEVRQKADAMPHTKLDDTSALIVIDLQKGVLGVPSIHPLDQIVDRTASLARAFRKRDLPVVLVNVSGRAPGRTDAGTPPSSPPAGWTDILPELEPQLSDHFVTKQSWGAFPGTTLHNSLRRRGVTQVVLTGVATSIGVESTARSAYDLGYNVMLVVDAMTDRNADDHRHSIERIFPRLGETVTAAEVLGLLELTAGRKPAC
jgi:nicotinamidase-related amidase